MRTTPPYTTCKFENIHVISDETTEDGDKDYYCGFLSKNVRWPNAEYEVRNKRLLMLAHGVLRASNAEFLDHEAHMIIARKGQIWDPFQLKNGFIKGDCQIIREATKNGFYYNDPGEHMSESSFNYIFKDKGLVEEYVKAGKIWVLKYADFGKDFIRDCVLINPLSVSYLEDYTFGLDEEVDRSVISGYFDFGKNKKCDDMYFLKMRIKDELTRDPEYYLSINGDLWRYLPPKLHSVKLLKIAIRNPPKRAHCALLKYARNKNHKCTTDRYATCKHIIWPTDESFRDLPKSSLMKSLRPEEAAETWELLAKYRKIEFCKDIFCGMTNIPQPVIDLPYYDESDESNNHLKLIVEKLYPSRFLQLHFSKYHAILGDLVQDGGLAIKDICFIVKYIPKIMMYLDEKAHTSFEVLHSIIESKNTDLVLLYDVPLLKLFFGLLRARPDVCFRFL